MGIRLEKMLLDENGVDLQKPVACYDFALNYFTKMDSQNHLLPAGSYSLSIS
jgi:hypothetical protein